MKLPNGYGGVVNLGKNRRRPFAARITVGWSDEGKAIYKYIGYYSKKAEALQALAEYTFKEVYEMWAEKALKDVTYSKLKSYTNAYAKCTYIYNIKIRELRAAHMQKVIDTCEKRSSSTLGNIKKLFNQVCRFALENDFINKDYSQFVSVTNADDIKVKSEFTEDEIKILWDNSHEYYVKFTLILIYTGFRISELLQLKIENIDLEKGTMQGGLKTKAGKNRIVPIHDRIKPFIEELYNPQNIYLYDNKGSAFKSNNIRDKFQRVLSKLGINHTPHECRHTTASLLDRYGANPITIKKIIGHSTQDLTSSVYIHKDLEELKKAINLIP